MLIPRFSIRLLLVVTAACSLLGPVLAAAARGRAWALGIVIGLVTAAAFLVVHALLFAAVSLIGRSGRALRRSSR